MKSNIYNATMGFVLGDIIGVPDEFKRRGTFTCTDMRASTFKDAHFPLPLGSWSDDTSLFLCVMDALTIQHKFDMQERPPMTIEDQKVFEEKVKDKVYNRFKQNSIKWMNLGKFTNHGYKVPFDVGNSCRKGILALMSGIPNRSANDKYSNGNGGLMRIPPLAFFNIEDDEELLDYIKLFNECSHNHEISHIGCLIYIRLAEKLMQENISLPEALSEVVSSIDEKYQIPEYCRIWDLSILDADINDVMSSGFVVHTLEAAIWCCANNESYESAILSAVNLGDDTDTVAALTGFLSGIYHRDIPERWIENIRSRKIVEKLIVTLEKGDN